MQDCKLSRPMDSGCTGQVTRFCFFSMHAHTWEVEAFSFSRVVRYSPKSADRWDADHMQATRWRCFSLMAA